MHFQTKISQITMYFQSKKTKNVAVPQSGHKK